MVSPEFNPSSGSRHFHVDRSQRRGLIIVGDLISEKTYLDEVLPRLEKGINQAILEATEAKFGKEGRQKIEAHMRELEAIEQQEEADEKEDETSEPPFIHLKNARFHHFTGSRIPVDQGVWWRGRLDAIDGFFLGTLRTVTE